MGTPQIITDRFFAVSGVGKVQAADGVGLINANIDTRDKATVSMSEVITRNSIFDCRNEDLVDENIRTRLLRVTLNYTEVSPQILARWHALYFGNATAPSGSTVNETQVIGYTGIVSGGTGFKLSITLEGRTAQTDLIPWNATPAQIVTALTAPRMVFVQPGDVSAVGTIGAGGVTVTFLGRLSAANLTLMTVDSTGITGGGTVSITAGVNGSQRLHAMARSVSATKVRTSIVMGWEYVTNRFEKYNDVIVESVSPVLNRRQNVSLTVGLLMPWTPEILTSFTVPVCVVIDPLLTDDCKQLIDGSWETTDINTVSWTLNDNVPTDDSSMFGFDGPDVQTTARGNQPTYGASASIFASESDAVYQKAFNELTQNPVVVITHFGQPGNRFSLIANAAKLKFQGTRMGSVGTLNRSVVNLDITPYKDGLNAPVDAEAYISQATAFLTV